MNKANLRELLVATGLVFLLKIVNHQFFCLCDLGIWWMTSKDNRAPLYTTSSFFASFHSHRWILTGITVRKCSIRVKIGDYLSRVTLKFGGWPWKTIGHLFYAISFKRCASFQSHRSIQAGVTVRKRSIQVKIGNYFSRVTLKFDEWPWKTIGHLFYATSSSVHNFKAIGQFKLELQSGNAQFGSKSAIFCRVWPWNMTDDLEKQ